MNIDRLRHNNGLQKKHDYDNDTVQLSIPYHCDWGKPKRAPHKSYSHTRKSPHCDCMRGSDAV